MWSSIKIYMYNKIISVIFSWCPIRQNSVHTCQISRTHFIPPPPHDNISFFLLTVLCIRKWFPTHVVTPSESYVSNADVKGRDRWSPSINQMYNAWAVTRMTAAESACRVRAFVRVWYIYIYTCSVFARMSMSIESGQMCKWTIRVLSLISPEAN